MYDTIHTEHGCGQVKCFGRLLLDYSIGDEVALHRSLSADEHVGLYTTITDAHASEGLDGVGLQMAVALDPRTSVLMRGEPTDESTYQVRMLQGGGFLHVRGGVIAEWNDTFEPGVVCYDSHGRQVGIIGVVGSRTALQNERCDRCSTRPVFDVQPAGTS